MKIFNANNLWETLQASFDKPATPKITIVEAVRKDPYPQIETANILGEDSGIIFSNRFLYDQKSHEELLNKIKSIKNKIKTDFDSTSLGQRLDTLQSAADSLKSQVITGKIEKITKPKVEKRKTTVDDDDEALLKEVEEEAQEVFKNKKTTTNPAKSAPSAETTDTKELVKSLDDLVKELCKETKQFATITMIQAVEKAIEMPDSYRGDTLGETYRRVIIPDPAAKTNVYGQGVTNPRAGLFDLYMDVSKILEKPELIRLVGTTQAYKDLNAVILTDAQLRERAPNVEDLPNAGADIFEQWMGCDVFAKEIFKYMADLVKSKGNFVGSMGNFKVEELNSGDFVMNDDKVSRNSLDEKYIEFVTTLTRAGIKEDVITYFNEVAEREDIGAELNKYICLKFVKMMSSDLKKLPLASIYKQIDSEFSGTEFINLFKSIVKNLEYYTPSIESVGNDKVSVDKNVYLQIYEANGEYYVVLYFEGLPPKRFALDRIGHRGYSNYIIKGLSGNRAEVLQDLYKKLVDIQIRNEFLTNRIQDPSQSAYKNSKYFNESVRNIQEETKRYTSAKMNYKRMIKKLAQFYGSDGHPAYNDTPLTKFTLSVEFKQMVSLFVDFSQTSENTFRITGVHYSSGDRAMGASLINLLSNKTGNYTFNTNGVKDLSNMPEGQRREIYGKITNFYTGFLSSLVNNLGNETVPTQAVPGQAPAAHPEKSPASKMSKEQLIAVYNEFNDLSDKEKRSPDEEKKLAQLSEIISNNLTDIKRYMHLSLGDMDELEENMDEAEAAIIAIPSYEQNKMVRRMNDLYDKLETANPKDQPKIQAEIDKITKFLVERGDFSKYRNVNYNIDKIEENLLDLSIADINPSLRTKEAALILLKNSPSRKEYKANARKNLEKYPHLKSYLENIYSPEFVRLVYAD